MRKIILVSLQEKKGEREVVISFFKKITFLKSMQALHFFAPPLPSEMVNPPVVDVTPVLIYISLEN